MEVRTLVFLIKGEMVVHAIFCTAVAAYVAQGLRLKYRSRARIAWAIVWGLLALQWILSAVSILGWLPSLPSVVLDALNCAFGIAVIAFSQSVVLTQTQNPKSQKAATVLWYGSIAAALVGIAIEPFWSVLTPIGAILQFIGISLLAATFFALSGFRGWPTLVVLNFYAALDLIALSVLANSHISETLSARGAQTVLLGALYMSLRIVFYYAGASLLRWRELANADLNSAIGIDRLPESNEAPARNLPPITYTVEGPWAIIQYHLVNRSGVSIVVLAAAMLGWCIYIVITNAEHLLTWCHMLGSCKDVIDTK